MPVKGMCNLRDIGGYPTISGDCVSFRVCLRGDSPYALTGEDIGFLKDYGLKTIIDLRSESEKKEGNIRLYEEPWVSYHSIRLMDKMFSAGFESHPESLSMLYIQLLADNGKEFADAARIISESDGVTLFHCAAGKDRTGMLAMLLLDLAGVPEEWIVADYTPSAENYILEAKKKLSLIAPEYKAEYRQFFLSERIDIECAICYLKENYGNAWHYFIQNGLDEATLVKLQNKLTKKAV